MGFLWMRPVFVTKELAQGHWGKLRDSSSPLLLESLAVPAPPQLRFWCSNPFPRASLCVADKPLPQSAPGGIIGIVGGVIAAVFIIGVAVTVIIVYRRQQKSRSGTDHDLIDLPPSHKPAPPPRRKQDTKSHLTPEDIQVVHLDNMKHEEEIQKFPLQTPYYDTAAPEPSPYSDTLNEDQGLRRRNEREWTNFGKCHSEISNASDYLTRCYSHEDRYLEKIPHVYAPLSDLPQDLYPHHSDISFCCPPPGSRAPYICPKEQYV
uniref:uncharacterized protein n=1 Tax=Lonchura striata TaxID=40157 RepID=UPI000B4DAE0C|nr:uncharacterized protein LOC110475957 [Lonchura striata domestica]